MKIYFVMKYYNIIRYVIVGDLEYYRRRIFSSLSDSSSHQQFNERKELTELLLIFVLYDLFV